MLRIRARRFHAAIAVLLSSLVGSPGNFGAVSVQHVVSSGEIRGAIADAAQARHEDLNKIERFFSADTSLRALKGAGMSYEKIKTAISLLDDQELAQLAARAQKAQEDFAAGALTREQLTYVVIALATAVVILIIIEAR